MKTSVGRVSNSRPLRMLSALCMRPLRWRISSRGVMSRSEPAEDAMALPARSSVHRRGSGVFTSLTRRASFPDCSRPSLLFHSPLPRGAAAGVAASTMPRSTLGGGGVPSPSPVSLSRVATVAESLLAAVSPTFGPHGMSQLLVDDANRLILTDSGHDILEVRPPRTEPRGPEPRGPEPRTRTPRTRTPRTRTPRTRTPQHAERR